MKNDEITLRSEDFAKWYTDVVSAAKLSSYSSVKGCTVLEPNGYAIWERMQSILDSMFKKSGHQNVYMPVLIPENLLKKEGELINGFAPECAWITEGGKNTLEERYAFRPTSETLFSDYYSKNVKTYRDLPKLYNQWCNVIRWEKETRPFLRSREFLWQEGHTAHSTSEEAEAETHRMLDTYKEFFEKYLAIPVITGKKTEKEKFAGAEFTITNEELMYNGVSLQDGTSHYFGQKFAKVYDVKFTNKEGNLDYVYQTSWGMTTRMIAAVIMVHGDDDGLVLPPRIAPKQVVIIPIGDVKELVDKINTDLNKNGIISYIDNSEKSPGFKFAEAEVNGIPVRIEIGERDLKENKITIARRDTREKIVVDKDIDIVKYVSELLETIQHDMYERAIERRDKLTFTAKNLEDMENILNTQPGFIHADWCGDPNCEVRIKEIKGCKSRCITDEPLVTGKCVCCGKDAKHHVIWGIQY